MADEPFANNLPGAQPLTRFMFEVWADPDDQHRAVVLNDTHVTAEGRELKSGDLITPNQARAEAERGLRWRALERLTMKDAGEFTNHRRG